MTNDDIDPRQLISDLRGGIPDECDFCGATPGADKIHPEEAGMWACIDCITRWDREDAEGRP